MTSRDASERTDDSRERRRNASSKEATLDLEFDPDAYDAVVYDLDGTVVRLAVDWNAVAEDVIGIYVEHAVKPPSEGIWELLGAASEYGLESAVEATIAEHERNGARDSRRLPIADVLGSERASRTAICSLNSEDACRIALQQHGLSDHVSAVVGRDTVGSHKPDPEPLLAALDAISAEPDRSLFVGDSKRDARTADRAGVEFVHAASE
ncbi:HAD family hydrolase [Halopenitus sp. H-Gu1]|uniref:HAD family hydrolase n=1 Tax=Halopenitus sp. H-Gu1 TaxID=3242697 RepID=UPI00359D63AF